jgi:hypothetical protein
MDHSSFKLGNESVGVINLLNKDQNTENLRGIGNNIK